MLIPVNGAEPVECLVSSADPRWQLVQRVIESPQFRKSPKLRELFLFVCDRGLRNAAEDLKEQRIGCHVFGRREDYNPGDDNIVRVEIRQLRKRLDDFFATGGKDEPLVVTIPKGSYVPSFEARKVEVGLQPMEALLPAAMPVHASVKDRNNRPWQIVAAACALIALLSLLPQIRWTVRAPAQRSPLWREIFTNTQDTHIVCADSALVIMEEIIGKPVSLQDYLGRTYPALPSKSASLDYLMSVLPERQYTSIADVHMVERLSQANSEFWDRTTIQSARTLNIMDLKKSNSILLGSSRANPWVELFEPHLNFVWTFDEKKRQGLLINRSPKSGEPPVYRSEISAEESYSVIDFVPNLNRTGSVLIVSGATMEGTEGAAEYATSTALTSELLGPMHAIRNGKLLSFEVVLRSGTIGGTSEGSQLVAYRVWNPATSS